MPVEWVKVGIDVGVGGVAGVGDQMLQNWDNKRAVEAGEKLAIMKQAGTYYNYGVPLAAVLLTAFGVLKGDMASRLVTAGAQLAGRKATDQITNRSTAAPWAPWRKDAAAEARRRAAEAEARGRERPLTTGSRLEF